jgi:hypothetical protein
MSDLRQRMQSVFATARKIALSGEEVMPIFFATTKDGQCCAYMTPFDGDESKDKITSYLRLAFAVRGVTSYVAVSEAWCVRRAPDEDPLAERPSECADREEVIIISGASRTEKLMGIAKLGYDGDNRTCADLEISEDGNASGRMVDLLWDEATPIPPGSEDLLKRVEAHWGINVEPFDMNKGTVH